MFKFLKGLYGNENKDAAKGLGLDASKIDVEKSKNVTQNLKPFEFNLNIDYAYAKEGKLVLLGWAYCAQTRIKKIEISYNDKIYPATIGLERTDVMDTFELCRYEDCGFLFEHILTNLENNRKLELFATGENDKIYTLKYEIPIEHWNPKPKSKQVFETVPNSSLKKGALRKIPSRVYTNDENDSLQTNKREFEVDGIPATIKKFDFKVHVDQSTLASNMLIIQGWAFCVDTKVKRIEIVYDGESKDAVIHFEREDVKIAFESCTCSDAGFYFQKYIDYTSTNPNIKLYIHGENNRIYEYDYELPGFTWFPKKKDVNRNQQYKRHFSSNNTISFKRRKQLESKIDSFELNPLISIIVPVYNVDVQWMEIAINSIITQVYANWELILVDDKSTSEPLIKYLKELNHPQIRIHWCEQNGHISKATNIGVGMSRGDFILFMDNDDKLDQTALYEVAKALNESPESEIFYSDEDKINTKEIRYSPVFKPDWSPELLLTTNYFNHILCVKKSLCEQVKFRSEFDGCQDWDFILRLIEISDKVYHIPKVLYNWRTLEGSISRSGAAKENISFLEKCEKAINLHLKRNDIKAIATRPEFAIESGAALFEINSTEKGISNLSIIIHLNTLNGKQSLLQSLAKTIQSGNNEILIYHDGPSEKIEEMFAAVSFEKYKIYKVENKSLSEIYNQAAKDSSCDNLLFLDEKIESVSEQLFLNLLLFSRREKVGVLGAKLLESDEIIHSTGYLLGLTNNIYNDLYPSKAFNKEANDNGYFYFKQILKNYSAVPKEFFFVKKEIFTELSGFDNTKFDNSLFEVDFCLRASQNGYRHIVLPSSTKIEIEGDDTFNLMDLKNFYDRYRNLTDPLYNPNFSKFDQYDYKVIDQLTNINNKKNLRLLFCTHNLNFEGAPIHIFEIIEQLSVSKDINFEIEVYSPFDGPLKERYIDLGVKVHLVPQLINTNPNKLRSEIHFDKNIRRIAKWLDGNNYDLVFCNTVLSFEIIIASDIVNIPTLWNIHESTPIDAFIQNKSINARGRLEEAFDVVSETIFSSKNTADLYQYYLKRNNYNIITNGIKEDSIKAFKNANSKSLIREELGIQKDNFVYLSLGSFGPRKGQMDFVLAALQRLKEAENPSELTFVMVGARKDPVKFSYTYNINSLLENSGFKDNFIVLPVVPDVNKYYFASDVFVCSSYNESSPRVILIAMLFDLPIITTPVYGIKEQVINNQNALYYTPGDIGNLNANMKTLYDDKKLLNKFVDNSSVVLSLSNSHEQMVKAYFKHIMSVC